MWLAVEYHSYILVHTFRYQLYCMLHVQLYCNIAKLQMELLMESLNFLLLLPPAGELFSGANRYGLIWCYLTSGSGDRLCFGLCKPAQLKHVIKVNNFFYLTGLHLQLLVLPMNGA